MIFRDRQQAGQRLALHLARYVNRTDVIVLGVPRGGVVIAFEVAKALHLPLDVLVLRKLGVPGHEELAFGAIASNGIRVLDREVVQPLGLSDLIIDAITRSEEAELARREHIYRPGRPPVEVVGKTVILVDDGMATGASLTAGVCALRQMHAKTVVVAVPVGPQATVDRLRGEVEHVICDVIPKRFFGVGQFYQDFSQLSDEDVNKLLNIASSKQSEPQAHHFVNKDPSPGREP